MSQESLSQSQTSQKQNPESQISKQELQLQDKNFDHIISIGLNDALLKPSLTNIISIEQALEAFQRRQVSGKISIKVQGQFFLSASQILRKKINIFTHEMREYFENFKKQNVTQIKRKVDPNKKKKIKKAKGDNEEDDFDDAKSNTDLTADLARNAIDDPRHQARQGGEDLAIADTFEQQDEFLNSNEEDVDLRHQSHQSSAFKSMMEESGKKTVKELSQAGSQAQSGFQTPSRNFDAFGYNPQIDEEDAFQSENKNGISNKDQNMIHQANQFFQNQMQNNKYAEDSQNQDSQENIRNKVQRRQTTRKQKKITLDEDIDLNSDNEKEEAQDDLKQYLRQNNVNNEEQLEIQLQNMLNEQLQNLDMDDNNKNNETMLNNQTVINMNLDYELDLDLQDDADIAAQNLNLKIKNMNLTAINQDDFTNNIQGSTFENTLFNNVGMNEEDFDNIPQYDNEENYSQQGDNNNDQNISDLFNATKLQDKTLYKTKQLSEAEKKEFRQFEQFYANLQRICQNQEQSISYINDNNPGSFTKGELFYNIMVLKKLGKINVRQDDILKQSELYITVI